MKIAIFLLSLSIYPYANCIAQDTDSLIIENPVELSVEKRNLGNTEQEVFMLHVKEANKVEVEKAWTKSLEKSNKAKMEINGNERTILGATIADIDKTMPFNVYSQIVEDRKGIKIYAAFQKSDSTWIDPESESGNTLRTEKVLMRFGRDIYAEVLSDKLSVENKKLKDLEKNHDSNLKSQTNLKKNIQSDSLAIFNNKNEIDLKKKEYSTVTEKLSQKRNEVASTNYTSEDAKKTANKLVKEIEKEQKQVSKEIEKLQNNTLDKEKDIAEYFYEIEQLKVEESEILKRVTNQKSRTKSLEEEIYQLKN